MISSCSRCITGIKRVLAIVAVAGLAMHEMAWAQTPAAAPDAAPERKADAVNAATAQGAPLTVESMAWLEGCWQGSANKREFREVWLPYRGGMMIGVSHTVTGDQTLSYEYLRLEARPDGVYYVATLAAKPEDAFKLTEQSVDKEDAHIYVFTHPEREFPRQISYRRASEGWLYAEVDGKVNGVERRLIYPMRRVDCQSGEFIRR